MTVRFPNPSRSFDAMENRVRFWGYDSVIEISFFVEVAALKKLCPGMSNVEAGILKAFDSAIKRIHEVAGKAHARCAKGSYTYSLATEDF